LFWDSRLGLWERFDAVPITFQFDNGILFSTIDGETGFDDVASYLDRLLVDPAFVPGMPGVIDCRTVKSLFSISDLRRMAADVRQRPQLQAPGRAAVLASSNLVYGLLRMYEVFSDGDPVEIRVFRRPEEAMAWLRGTAE
jgi:hypothetical protein